MLHAFRGGQGYPKPSFRGLKGKRGEEGLGSSFGLCIQGAIVTVPHAENLMNSQGRHQPCDFPARLSDAVLG